MNDQSILYIQRAENELVVADILNNISKNEKIQTDIFKLEKDFTFFSSVISQCYYCIFYSAKSILIQNGFDISGPEIHRKTFESFDKNLIQTGKIDEILLQIYRNLLLKSDELLSIFSIEKRKRGEYTYQKLPQSNIEPASESLDNARLFFKIIRKIIYSEYN